MVDPQAPGSHLECSARLEGVAVPRFAVDQGRRRIATEERRMSIGGLSKSAARGFAACGTARAGGARESATRGAARAAGGDGGLGGIGSAQGAQRPSTGRAPRKFGGKAETGAAAPPPPAGSLRALRRKRL